MPVLFSHVDDFGVMGLLAVFANNRSDNAGFSQIAVLHQLAVKGSGP